ncbi:hypothetical protein VUR80DRAFT_7353 [Thermomyces stellatus]
MAPTEVSAASPPRRSSRSFSFHSDKSNKASSHRQSVSRVHETPEEKESHRLRSKADPTLAMNEAEPSAVAAGERSSLAPLRAIQHRDVFGNPIVEPDRSNPTRNRWERPLDTIRSFEAAIEGPYAQRAIARQGSEADWSRRESYFAPRSVGPSRPPSIYSSLPNPQRQPQDGYYGNQPSPHFNGKPSPAARDSYHEPVQQGAYGPYPGGGGYGGYSNGSGAPYSNYPQGSRSQLSSQYNGNRREPNHVYTLQNRDRSYETVTSATGSGTSGDQGSYRTDPSSDNNSVDRASPPKPPGPAHDHGIGFNNITHQPPAFTVGPMSGGSKTLKKPAPDTVGAPTTEQPTPQKGQPVVAQGKPAGKRRSWFFRRFSKNT